MKSKLLFESFSNSSKSVNLVSHSLLAHDTRFTGCSGPTEGKHNVFDCILQPSKTGNNRASLQLELHYRYAAATTKPNFYMQKLNTHITLSLYRRSTRDSSHFTVVLNNLRVFLIFDWLQLVRDFLHMPVDKEAEPTHQRWPSGSSDVGSTGAVMPKTVKTGVVTKRTTVPVIQDKYLEVKINVTGNEWLVLSCCLTLIVSIGKLISVACLFPGTEFVVVEDSSCLDTNAIILKGTTVLTYKPRLLDRPFSGSLAGIEVTHWTLSVTNFTVTLNRTISQVY